MSSDQLRVNGGAFRGSLRAERYFRPNNNVQRTVQIALSQQVITDFVVNPLIVGEDNGWMRCQRET